MSTRVRDVLMGTLGELRHEPTQKRIRAELGGATVVDSTRAMLVWEPGRVVPTYAVPEDDLDGDVGDATAVGPDDIGDLDAPRLGDLVVLDPSIPFVVHTTAGSR